MTERQKIVEYALSQIGTAEDPLGSNRQKYGAFLDSTNWYLYKSGDKEWIHKVNGYDWCTQFVDASFITNFGIDKARKMLNRPQYNNYGAVVKYAYNYFCRAESGFPKAKYTPKPGDVIYFQNNAGLSHTGIVVDVTETNVITVEGNTGKNGYYVAKKTYRKSSTYIYGYGCPAYTEEDYKELNGYKVGETYKVIVDDLMLRKGPGKPYESVGSLKTGDLVTCDKLDLDGDGNTWLMVSGGWCCGLYGGVRYISTETEPKTIGWVKRDGLWYYYDKDGVMVTLSWIKYKGAYYYLGAAGVMVTGWQIIDHKKYYFRANGDMVTSEWIEGLALDADGVQRYAFPAEWKEDGRGKWYQDSSGLYPRSKTLMVDGVACEFDKDGYLIG